MEPAESVSVRVSLSGWLSSYFEAQTMTMTLTPRLQDALPELLEQIHLRAKSPLPNGGMHILVNGVQARKLVQENYVLRAGDQITLVPVVAGGAAGVITV